MDEQSEANIPSPAAPAAPRSSKKRKLQSTWSAATTTSSSATKSTHKSIPNPKFTCSDEDNAVAEVQNRDEKPKRPRNKEHGAQEKRLRRFRPTAPSSFNEIYGRATSQRFYVLARSRSGTPQCPEESVELTGSTGNIYTVHIAQQPICSCPHAKAGNQCKHILYVMSRVLRARFDLVYQLALLSTELVEIFANAPPIEVGDDAKKPKEDKNRKAVEGDCPICFAPFEEVDAIVFCRATCGQNIHKECFEMWAAAKRQNHSARDRKVTCPMCRTPWQGDDDMVRKIQNTRRIGSEGYVNVADQLGISTIRGKEVCGSINLRSFTNCENR
jgi:hypothetical protein